MIGSDSVVIYSTIAFGVGWAMVGVGAAYMIASCS